MSTPKPTVGRIVHYVARGSADGVFPPACRAAIVTEVDPQDDGGVGLCVLNPTGQFFNRGVEHDDGDPHYPSSLCTGMTHRGGTWHWPART